MLEQHDMYRCMHDAGKVTWNEDAATQAQNWADHLMSIGHMEHACPEGQDKGPCTTPDGTYWGENIYSGGGSGMAPDIQAINSGAVPDWYKEMSLCSNNGACTGSEGAGHYTQVVWKETTQIGCGLSVEGDATAFSWYLVCRYAKAGNMAGDYANNVAPLNGKSEDECSDS